MKAAVEFKATTRETIGTGGARELRRQGFTPVNVYSAGSENQALAIETRAISNEYFRGGFMNKIVAFKGAGGKDIFAIPRDVQLNPVSDKIEHADFQAVNEKSVVKVRVPVSLINADKSIGIKRGGVLNTVAREVDLLCDVAHIPTKLEIDLAPLDIGTTIHIHNIELPKGVQPARKGVDFTIASITGRQKEEEADASAAPTTAAVPSTKSAAADAAAAAKPGDAKGAAKPAAKK